MTSATLRDTSGKGWLRTTLAAILTTLLAVGALITSASFAQANTPGINIAVLHNGTVVEDGATIPEGDDLLLRIQYNANEDIEGEEVTITVPNSISIEHVPAGNEAVESIIDNGDGTITIKFRDVIPEETAEGALAVSFRAGQVEDDEDAEISWTIDDSTTTVSIVIENQEAPPTQVEDEYWKNVNPTNLDGYVLRGDAPGYAFLGLDEAIEDAVLVYTLTIDSEDARTGFLVEDVLPAGLSYEVGSFDAQLTTYNPETVTPHTFDPTVSGNTFTGTVDVPENSTLRITYEAKVTDRAALEALLQAEFDERNDTPGDYEINLRNTVTYGGDDERSASVRLRGNIPGVGIGQNFNKAGSWTVQEVIADEDGTLTPPAEITYSFRANLSPWDERNPNFTLQQNVVIRDVLHENAEWLTGDADFITVTGEGPITSFTEAGTCPTSAQDFAGDEFIGQYCVDGNTLLINVGDNDPEDPTDITVHVRAQLNSIDGLGGGSGTTIIGGTSYLWPNSARFYYRDGDPASRSHDADVVVLPEDREDGINDWTAFLKAGPSGDVRVNPGDVAEIPYRFTIDTSRDGIDPLNSKIVDYVDTDIFDISDLSAISISGSYAGHTLTADHFALSLDDEGNLVVELSEAGKAVIEDLEEDATWIIDLVLVTVPFEGKETFEIHNYAVLFGSDGQPAYWNDDDAEATSFGDEAELRKRVYDDIPGEWTRQLNAEVDENGEFINDIFVYRIEFIPRGDYGSAFPVQIFTFTDELPEAVEFIGFVEVDDEETPILDTAENGPVDLPGNLQASHSDGVVTVEQIPGTNLNPNEGKIAAYFAVRGIDADGPIINRVGNSTATIDPYGVPSIDIEKWNDEGTEPEYDDTGALVNDGYDGDFDEGPGKELTADEALEIRFTVSNDGREDLIDIVVSDELTGGVGQIEGLVCEFPDGSRGTTWEGTFAVGTQFQCSGTLPGLVAGDTHSNTAQVTGAGIISGIVVDDQDDWHGYVPEEDGDGTDGGDDGVIEEVREDDELPVTGTNSAALLFLVPSLLLAGAAVLLYTKRRRLEV